MAEAVMERVEVEAGTEEVFGFLSDRESVCALVRMAEDSRRVDLSVSRWNFRSPAGLSVEVGPDAFRGCLRRERLGGGAGEEMAGPSSPDLVLGDVFIDFKTLSSRKTLLSLTYHWANLAQAAGRAADEDLAGGLTSWAEMRRDVNLDLRALIENLLAASWSEGELPPHLYPPPASAVADAPAAGSVEGFPEDAMTDEDRAWLEGDLSRLGEYGSYELTEEELADEQPIRYVPGLGLMVDDDGDPVDQLARPLAIRDVVSATFPRQEPGGREQHGYRPAVVVGLPESLGAARFPMVFLAPFTTDEGQAWATISPGLYPRFSAGAPGLKKDSICLIDQARALDARRLGGRRGTLTAAQYRPIEAGLAAILGLPSPAPVPSPSPAPPGSSGAGGTP